MSIVLRDCQPMTAIERTRAYVAQLDLATPEHRGRTVAGVLLQARRPWRRELDPPDPFDMCRPDGAALSYSDLSQGF